MYTSHIVLNKQINDIVPPSFDNNIIAYDLPICRAILSNIIITFVVLRNLPLLLERNRKSPGNRRQITSRFCQKKLRTLLTVIRKNSTEITMISVLCWHPRRDSNAWPFAQEYKGRIHNPVKYSEKKSVFAICSEVSEFKSVSNR